MGSLKNYLLYNSLKWEKIMLTTIGRIAPVFFVFLALFLIDGGVNADFADARSRMGGKMFSRPAPKKAPVQQNMQQTNKTTQKKGGFSKGLAGGLMGGAIAGLLFGSLFGAPGAGMGLLPILLLAGAGFFLFRRFAARSAVGAGGGQKSHANMFSMGGEQSYQQPSSEEQAFAYLTPVEQGLQEIQQTDPGFDKQYFLEVASDVFFQVQAGWMRRELESYRHLLGEQLGSEYAAHFAEMKERGHINKLESIAIRKVEVVNAGSDGSEDFVTVLFTANLLDYTVDENSGETVSGSNTTPVKFAEEWTWARVSGTDGWLLEGIKVVSG